MELRAILSRALEDYKSNPVVVVPRLMEFLIDGVVVLLVALMGMALFGYSFETSLSGLSFSTLALGFVSLSVAGLLLLMVTAAARAAIVAMALQAYMGHRALLSHGIEGVKANTHKLFLYFVFLFGVLALLWVIIFTAVSLYPPIIFFILPIGLLAFFSLYLLTFLTPQQIVVRECGVIDGIAASASFVVNNYRKVLGYGLFVMFIALGIWLLPSAVFFIINEVTRYHPFLNLAAGIFHSLLSLAVGIAVSPYLEMVKTYMVVGEIHGRVRENKKEEIEEDAGES